MKSSRSIGVPQIENSIRQMPMFSEVIKWGAVEKIEAMRFDTTAVNTCHFRGTCVLLEQLFKKDLLYLACRHHILEVILKAVFDCKIGSTTGPEPGIFKRFQTAGLKFTQKNIKLVLPMKRSKLK